MIIVLPLDDLFAPVLSVDVIVAVQSSDSLPITRVALALPKFKFESTYEDALKSALQSIGVVAPFVSGLCIRQGSCDAFIDFIIQKTVIAVNELGVEAAAVTAIGVTESAPPPELAYVVMCDHPFQFFIYDGTHNVVLFEGRVGNPGIPEGSTATLTMLHSNDTFWSTNFYADTIVVEPNADLDLPATATAEDGNKNNDNNNEPPRNNNNKNNTGDDNVTNTNEEDVDNDEKNVNSNNNSSNSNGDNNNGDNNHNSNNNNNNSNDDDNNSGNSNNDDNTSGNGSNNNNNGKNVTDVIENTTHSSAGGSSSPALPTIYGSASCWFLLVVWSLLGMGFLSAWWEREDKQKDHEERVMMFTMVHTIKRWYPG